MTIVSLIPPIVDGDATVRDADDPLSVACYWVLPFVAPGLAMLVTSKYPDWFVEASGSEEAVPAAAGPPDRLSGPVDDAVGLVVHLEPADVLADETAAVHVIGAAPDRTVSLSAETIDAFGHRWRSTATADADVKGTLELADPNALIWSMNFDSKDATPDLFIPPAEPAVTLVVAEAAGKRSHGTLVRRVSAPDVDVQDVRAPGVVGRLFSHPAQRRRPRSYSFPAQKVDLTRRPRTPTCSPLMGAPLWWRPRSPVTALRSTDYLSDWSECRSSASPMQSVGSQALSGSTPPGCRRWRSLADLRVCWRRLRASMTFPCA